MVRGSTSHILYRTDVCYRTYPSPIIPTQNSNSTMPTLSDAHQLLQLADLTKDSIHRIIGEWAKLPTSAPGTQGKGSSPGGDSEANLPSRALFEAQRTLLATTGKLVELISSPSSRLLEVSSQYNEARCLHIAAVLRIPDLLADHGGEGVPIERLAEKVGIETRKLGMYFPATYLHARSVLMGSMICGRSYYALSLLNSHLPRDRRWGLCQQRHLGWFG